MAQPPKPQLRQWKLGAYVAGCAFAVDGRSCAFALGDGSLRVIGVPVTAPPVVYALHQGAVLSLAATAAGYVSGGDDGRLVCLGPDGQARTLYEKPGTWLEPMAVHAGGAVAVGAGREVLFWARDAAEPARLGPHPSTVAGLAFTPDGRDLAASHYNGVSLWRIADPAVPPRRLDWKGSMLSLAVSPDGAYLGAATQDHAIHVWRLPEGKDMQMSGYPSKIKALAWTSDGAWMASGGADAFVLWPFDDKGPEGRPPTEFAWRGRALATLVAVHPDLPVVAAGLEDGRVLLADIPTKRLLEVWDGGGGALTALAWSRDGMRLAAGCEKGPAAIILFGR